MAVTIFIFLLGYYKYYAFFLENLNTAGWLKGKVEAIAVPIGISFLVFEVISYIVDIARGNATTGNLSDVALYLAFFPKLVSGPIILWKHFQPQINARKADITMVTDGIDRIIVGYAKKAIIADTLGMTVAQIRSMSVTGIDRNTYFIWAFLYMLEIYFDFSGYSDIAIGAAQVLGFQVTNNFHQPYFSRSVAEFWRRWHISLSSWFRDYIYIPLGGNRHGKWVQYRNILIVFIISGLWHGASWNFIVWGGIHGIFQIVENFSMPMRNKLKEIAKIKTDCFSYHFFQTALTFFAVDFAWIFFRAPGAKTALHIIKKMLSPEFSSFHIEELFHAGLNKENFCVLFVSLILLLIVDLFRHNQNIRQFIEQQNLPFRWLIYYCGIFSIIIFGIYGPGYDASTFVYMQF